MISFKKELILLRLQKPDSAWLLSYKCPLPQSRHWQHTEKYTFILSSFSTVLLKLSRQINYTKRNKAYNISTETHHQLCEIFVKDVQKTKMDSVNIRSTGNYSAPCLWVRRCKREGDCVNILHIRFQNICLNALSLCIWISHRNHDYYIVNKPNGFYGNVYQVSQGSMLVRALDSWSKGCEFESRQERRENFLF